MPEVTDRCGLFVVAGPEATLDGAPEAVHAGRGQHALGGAADAIEHVDRIVGTRGCEHTGNVAV